MDVNVSRVSLEDFNGDKAADKLFEEAVESENLDDLDLGILFCSSNFDLEAIVGRLGYLVQKRGGELVGGTTAGEISSKGASIDSAVFMAIESDKTEFQVGFSEDVWESTQEKGKIAAIRATKDNFFVTDKNKAIFALPPGFTSDRPAVEFKILNGISKEIDSGIPIAGGSTGDNLALEENYQFHNQDILSKACILVAMRTDYRIISGQEHGLSDKVKTGVISETDKNIIREINGKPAAEYYADAVGKEVETLKDTFENEVGTELQNIFMEALDMTLGEELNSGRIRALTPVQVTEEHGIYTTVEPKENNSIHIIEGDRDEIVNAARDSFPSLEDLEPKFSMVSDCAIRSAAMDLEDMEEEISKLAERIDCPLIGFYGYGEIGGKESYCTNNNQTVSGILVAEETS